MKAIRKKGMRRVINGRVRNGVRGMRGQICKEERVIEVTCPRI
jgi:hypothetical protein